MSNQLQSFQYQPLEQTDSFRLLELQRGSEHDQLICHLHQIKSIASAPPYECISYVWGRTKDTEEIQCRLSPNSQLYSLSITSSLAGILRRLRYSDKNRLVWADGICINQQDLLERQHQVTMMGKIYGQAAAVAIWLGQSDQDTQPAIELMSVISDRCRAFVHPQGISLADWEKKLVESEHFLDYLPERDDAIASTSQDPRTTSLDKLFGRQWFRRTWVIQEVAKCNTITVYCGALYTPWSLIALAASWCLYGPGSYDMQERFRNVDGISNAVFMRDKVWQTADTVTFFHLLGRGKDFDATDSRDKVYAMLSYPIGRLSGGSSSAFQFNIIPDYTKTTAEVYTLVVLQSVQLRQDLEVLSYVDHGPAIATDYPSWIPRWDKPCTAGMLDQLGRLFDATLVKESNNNIINNASQIPLSCTSTSLTLSGVQCGTVDQLTETMELLDLAVKPEAIGQNPILGSFRKAPGNNSGLTTPVFALSDSSPYGGFEETIHAYARTLSLGRVNGMEIPAPSTLELQQVTADFASYILDILNLAKQSNLTSTLQESLSGTKILNTLSNLATQGSGSTSRFVYPLGYACHRRKFFRTAGGHIGIGPAALREGDSLCLLRGGRMVYALRRLNQGRWQFIGDCYLHGFMNGEAADLIASLSDQSFELW